MTAVHQLLPVYTPGDAISGAARMTQTMLQDLGFDSEIYADLIDRSVQHDAQPAADLWQRLDSADTVIYHLSIGSNLVRPLRRMAARLVLTYHNITPVEFFGDTNPTVTYWLGRGREDLAQLAPCAAMSICDSPFNLAEASAAGAPRTAVIPPPVDIDRLQPVPSEPGSAPEILFVGRLAPNKGHDQLLRVLAALRATTQPDARLILAGAPDTAETYVSAVRSYAQRLGVAHAVEIADHRLSDSALRDRYATASVFACASQHEGFCIPLIEAMAFSLPIVALDAGAVADTLGGAGMLLRSSDPLVWAAVVDEVIANPTLRERLIHRGARRLHAFDHAVIRDQLRVALADIGVTP